MPLRLTDFSITEEAFDPNLNPIRAKVSLGLRVLNVDDLGFDTPGLDSWPTSATRSDWRQGDLRRDFGVGVGRLAVKSPLQSLI